MSADVKIVTAKNHDVKGSEVKGFLHATLIEILRIRPLLMVKTEFSAQDLPQHVQNTKTNCYYGVHPW